MGSMGESRFDKSRTPHQHIQGNSLSYTAPMKRLQEKAKIEVEGQG